MVLMGMMGMMRTRKGIGIGKREISESCLSVSLFAVAASAILIQMTEKRSQGLSSVDSDAAD